MTGSRYDNIDYTHERADKVEKPPHDFMNLTWRGFLLYISIPKREVGIGAPLAGIPNHRLGKGGILAVRYVVGSVFLIVHRQVGKGSRAGKIAEIDPTNTAVCEPNFDPGGGGISA